MSTWVEAYQARNDLEEYSDNALALFSLALRFGVEDLAAIAAESITDGNDDKKCDMVYMSPEEKYAVIAQCYYSNSKTKKSAPANKASDLNTAVAWLLESDISDVPERLKSAASNLRASIENGDISDLHIWYVHNLPVSTNVCTELETVARLTESLLSDHKVNIIVTEVGHETLKDWYDESLTPILVSDEFSVKIDGGYEIAENEWKAYSTTLPARFLYTQYKKHKEKIFSANVRDYLGARSSDSNINNGIVGTLRDEPENFWAFNNGLTILTHKFEEENNVLSFRGMSIVNGAQTTGAIGSQSKRPSENARVQARFVAVNSGDPELIHKIIQFNNSQNKIEASDFRSTDKVQKRLKEEFNRIPDSEYEGGRRGGVGSAIKRRPKLLSSYSVGQALACFQLDPIVSYNQKTSIWADDRLYSKYFNENTNAAHIVCAYSLIKSIEAVKKELVNKSKSNSLTTADESMLSYFRQRGSIFLFASALVSCLEVILSKKITNKFRVSFGSNISPKEAEKYWKEILDVTLPFCSQLNKALVGGLKNQTTVKEVIDTFRSLVQAHRLAIKAYMIVLR